MLCRLPMMLLTAMVAVALSAQSAGACPFCAAVSQTFAEEIASMDAVVFVRMVQTPAPSSSTGSQLDADVPKARFEIFQVIKGQELLGKQRTIETIYFGEGKKGASFLLMGVDPPKLMWSTPLPVSERARKYITQVVKLPAEGVERLDFFQKYLEDADEMLARDAYDEFAKASYDQVKAVKDRMDHDQLVAWIQNPDIPASRRRLYLTMLGVCGKPDDLQMLESMLRSEDRKMRNGLDALIACYLTLRGPDGMGLVEDLFLKNKDAEYADTYAAIMALRFHADQGDVIPTKRVLEGLRHMLERPQLADLVIPDLARWEDWSQTERLVKLFKEADEKSSWVRVPVINYLRACPKPEAKQYIKELEQIDPDAVKRANTFFPTAPATGTQTKTKTS